VLDWRALAPAVGWNHLPLLDGNVIYVPGADNMDTLKLMLDGLKRGVDQCNADATTVVASADDVAAKAAVASKAYEQKLDSAIDEWLGEQR
jgi:hypothetical protein